MAEVLIHMRTSSFDASPVLLRFSGACQCDGEFEALRAGGDAATIGAA